MELALLAIVKNEVVFLVEDMSAYAVPGVVVAAQMFLPKFLLVGL
jgi:hypothetical protein